MASFLWGRVGRSSCCGVGNRVDGVSRSGESVGVACLWRGRVGHSLDRGFGDGAVGVGLVGVPGGKLRRIWLGLYFVWRDASAGGVGDDIGGYVGGDVGHCRWNYWDVELGRGCWKSPRDSPSGPAVLFQLVVNLVKGERV